MRPSRRTWTILPELRNRTRRRITRTPKRAEVSRAGFADLNRAQIQYFCVTALLSLLSHEELCEHGLIRPEENQDKAQEISDEASHISGCSRQRIHQRWSVRIFLKISMCSMCYSWTRSGFSCFPHQLVFLFTDQVFGCSLTSLCQRENTSVPIFVTLCIDHVEDTGKNYRPSFQLRTVHCPLQVD